MLSLTTAATMRALLLWFLVAPLGDAFTPAGTRQFRSSVVCYSTAEQVQHERFQEIALKLRTSIHSNGFDSKDPKFGVETIQATIPIRSGEGLGLELLQIAHSTTEQNKGLVLISGVSGNAAKYTEIEEGDTLVGVSCKEAHLKLSTTGLDYDATMDAIVQAKTHAELLNDSSISFQLNRLVRRAPVQVIVENNGAEPTVLDCLAGDNLRLVCMRNSVYFSSSDCGGEGVCGTDMIEIVEGEDAIDYLGASSSTSGPIKACQTIVGANNQASTIRIRLASPEEE